ncbi:hypothetical protein H310_14440 [Aphanomyces invadans]|uniref:Uncharacterized protein n=1 Tax=Aphanomyces invadans TaxID=157072 RepID=A0A024TA17_9STRA|nr:hypothetical protein H310_14440 [Aphanomyces invadans]ETV90844.1 hypothetical protein H310_14440 [Aphanomyces invadans]|eukprot:XP_008880522.1 hypothetical protein H310_14440 [Aphanomyces invadans]
MAQASEASPSSKGPCVRSTSDDDTEHKPFVAPDDVKEKYHALLSTMEQQRTQHAIAVKSGHDVHPSHHVHAPRNVDKHEPLEKHVRTGLPQPNIVHQKHIMQPKEDKPNRCSAKITKL